MVAPRSLVFSAVGPPGIGVPGGLRLRRRGGRPARPFFWLLELLERYDRRLRAAVSESFPEPTDAELVERALSGNQDAFEQLVRRHYRSAVAIVRRILPPWLGAADVADVVQQVCSNMYQGLDTFQT